MNERTATQTASARTGPLSGFRILDLTANMTGPYATMILAEQGAEVVKIEPPGGEVIRSVGTGRPGLSVYFANLNRGKRSIGVDLKKSEEVLVAAYDDAQGVTAEFNLNSLRRLNREAGGDFDAVGLFGVHFSCLRLAGGP